MQHAQSEWFVTSGGFAIGQSHPTREAAWAARVELAREGVTDLDIEEHVIDAEPVDRPVHEPQEMTTDWVSKMEASK